jgi:hypothetical protein
MSTPQVRDDLSGRSTTEDTDKEEDIPRDHSNKEQRDEPLNAACLFALNLTYECFASTCSIIFVR